MLKRCMALFALWGGALALPAFAQDSGSQDARYGFSLPVTLSGGAMYTGRLQFEDPGNSPVTPGFQAMLYPTLTLGPHWFAYAAQQFRLTPYLYYDAYDPDHEWYVETLQAFIGYQIRREKTTVVFKAGRLTSAFGAFPLHYDDADNALLDQPLSYIQTLTLRNNQLPCGVADLLWQNYGYVSNLCGGASGGDEGLTPVTLYGLPGIQAEVSSHRVDGRIQVTSGSPANPLSVSHAPQYAQWVLGGGYTILQGFRVGISGFRGPYLSPNVAPLLARRNFAARFSCQRPWPGRAVGARALERQRGMAALPIRFAGVPASAFGKLHLWRSQAGSHAAALCRRAGRGG